jgi:hypothetical protein
MKALRYILSLIAILSVVSVAAATFGKPYQPQGHGVQYASSYTQMPTLPMSSTGSAMMKSGSALPMAAVSGTTTADDCAPARSSRPRRVGEDDGFDNNDDDPDTPANPFPLGDAMLPMLLCAAVFCGAIAIRRKRSAIKGEG